MLIYSTYSSTIITNKSEKSSRESFQSKLTRDNPEGIILIWAVQLFSLLFVSTDEPTILF